MLKHEAEFAEAVLKDQDVPYCIYIVLGQNLTSIILALWPRFGQVLGKLNKILGRLGMILGRLGMILGRNLVQERFAGIYM